MRTPDEWKRRRRLSCESSATNGSRRGRSASSYGRMVATVPSRSRAYRAGSGRIRLRTQADQPVLEGVAHQVGACLQAQLAQDVAAVRLDGADAQVQLPGDLLVRVAERDQPQDLALAVGQ